MAERHVGVVDEANPPQAPPFSPEAVEGAEAAVAALLEGDSCEGLELVAVAFRLARAALAAPAVRREVEERWQDGYMAAHESAVDALCQEVHARCEAEAERDEMR